MRAASISVLHNNNKCLVKMLVYPFCSYRLRNITNTDNILQVGIIYYNKTKNCTECNQTRITTQAHSYSVWHCIFLLILSLAAGAVA